MRKSKVFLWSSLVLLLGLFSCEDDEVKVWEVYYQVALRSGSGGEYRVWYTNASSGRTLQLGGITDDFWESDIVEIEEEKEVSFQFERTSGESEYRIRIYVGGAHVEEAIIPQGVDAETIEYVIPGV